MSDIDMQLTMDAKFWRPDAVVEIEGGIYTLKYVLGKRIVGEQMHIRGDSFDEADRELRRIMTGTFSTKRRKESRGRPIKQNSKLSPDEARRLVEIHDAIERIR